MNDDQPEWTHPDIPPPPPRTPQTKDSRNHYTSARNQRDRDVWAAERWVRDGWTHRQIADALGLRAKSSAHEAVERGLRTPNAEREQRAAETREILRARLERYHDAALEVMERKHITVSHGKVITTVDEDTGKETPLLDDAPVLAAIDRLLRINESQRKLDGHDQPAKVEHSGGVSYEIIGVDPQDLR